MRPLCMTERKYKMAAAPRRDHFAQIVRATVDGGTHRRAWRLLHFFFACTLTAVIDGTAAPTRGQAHRQQGNQRRATKQHAPSVPAAGRAAMSCGPRVRGAREANMGGCSSGRKATSRRRWFAAPAAAHERAGAPSERDIAQARSGAFVFTGPERWKALSG